MRAVSLPVWDLSSAYSSFESPEYLSSVDNLSRAIAELENNFDSGISTKDLIERLDSILYSSSILQSFTGGSIAVNTKDDIALRANSRLEKVLSNLHALLPRIYKRLGKLDDSEKSSLNEYGYFLQRAKMKAKHSMSDAEEALAADLNPSGINAFVRLQDQTSSQIEIDWDGEIKTMSEIRILAHHSNREIRKKAYEKELTAFRKVETVSAASLNSVKGTTLTLSKRRGWNSPLDESLFAASIDRETLNAMLNAAKKSFPMFRKYLHLKAKGLGIGKCSFYDIFAPLGDSKTQWTWEQTQEFIIEKFTSYSTRMGEFARRAFQNNWHDVGPRSGKVGGAFCMPFINDESRILLNFSSDFESVSTVAHELGHAYHNYCLGSRTEIQKELPMTLAETASIFCETIVGRATLATLDDEEKLPILESRLQGACQVVVDISSRFQFESKVFEKREIEELSPSEFCETMIQAQVDTYGDGLNESELHPYMWAAKPHYYAYESFYNYPYMFGMLFGLGLYANYEKDPEKFKSEYDDFLSRTGLADAASLGQEFSIDICDEEFWFNSLSIIQRDIDEFERLIQLKSS